MYTAKYINPLIQFGKTELDLVIEDDANIMPPHRLHKTFNMGITQEELITEANREMDRLKAEWELSQQIPVVIVSTPTEQELNLWRSENNYILFCRSLGLPDVASTEDFETFCMNLKNIGNALLALEISVKALALINAVTQNGGKWASIKWHEEIT